MVATPQVIGPDGTPRVTTIFSTTIPSRFFQGTMGPDIVDMQISIRGGPFTSDPDLLVFEGTTFAFPNPTVFPEGLELAAGKNVIEIRAISFSGAVSAVARVEATLVQEADVGLIGTPPSNISVEQHNDDIKLRAERVEDSAFQGMNFYASRFQGGGATGYQRININTVTDFEVVQETSPVGSSTVNSPVASNPDGTHAADPLYVQIKQTETRTSEVLKNLEDVSLTPDLAAAITFQEQENLVETDFVEIFEVPETATLLRTTLAVDVVVSRAFFTFVHNRQFGPSNEPPTVPIGEFAGTPTTEPLYYVATAVFFDEERQLEIESSFSVEVVAKPVVIQDNVGTFPSPSRIAIAQRTIDAITRTTPKLAVQPGAVIRDTVVDPVSSEATRLRLLVDFLYRIQSFDTLLQIDGLESDGTPTPVSRSPYKQALGRVFSLQNPADIQILVDTSFEQLASRNNVFRRSGTRARGFVIFFTRNRPTVTLLVPLGTVVASGGVQFVTTTDAAIPINNVGAFFNPSTGFYQINVPVEAQQPGTSGNLGAGQIRTIVSTLSGLSVTNPNPTFGGRSQETNFELAVRARRALAAVDSGTETGTLQDAADVAGVLDLRVVPAGSRFMQRDYEEALDKHVGGKVDVWVRGSAEGTVSDTFAFMFETASDIQFQIVGNPNAFLFRALDQRLSPTNPIAEMLDDPSIGLGFRNATTGSFFDLTNVQVVDYRTIQLSDEVVQPEVSFGHILLGDYRYVTSSRFVLSRQPATSIRSLTGQVSGELSEDHYQFVRPDDPLMEGRSVRARSFLQVLQTNGIPNGEPIEVEGEQHIMLAEFNEFLFNLGANVLKIRVFNSSRTVLYRGPSHPSGVSDYVIVQGTQTTPVALRRTPTSQIASGESILVDYEHAENFTVEYETNFVVPTVQEVLDAKKHLTADVLVKASVPVPVDVTATIVTRSGMRSSAVDTNVRTNIATFLRALGQGAAIRQSDMIAVIDNTRGVSYVETPLRKMTRGAGSLAVRERIPSEPGEVTILLGTTSLPYSTSTVKTWLLQNPLANPTMTGGGDETRFVGVFKDDRPMVFQRSTPTSLKNDPDRAFIIGDEGLSIPGFSDDTTIQTSFPAANTPAEIERVRRQLTANRVLVSLAADDRPDLHTFTATYMVGFVDTRSQDLEANPLEYFEPGDLIFTFVEDTRSV